ncbi:MAG: TIGR03915 family putative DNA repair protein [Coriobacteriales bacterium]|jgi:probable DNA metabolism protein|nr:TIGR03915 family putative DNA repair protein [Coriobacteriales bacterium]
MDSFSSLIASEQRLFPLLDQRKQLGSQNVGEASFSSLIDDAELIYLYDGSLEGMLSAVFAAFQRHENPEDIVTSHALQESLLSSYVPVQTEEPLAARVRNGILEKLGDSAYEDVKKVFLSDAPHKGGVIFRYLHYAFTAGRWSFTHLAEPAVADFLEIRRQVESEAHHMLMFVRFAQLSNGMFYAHIEPKASVVPLITDHFAQRLNVQPFIIYDSVHNLASVFDTERWWLVSADEINAAEHSRAEDDFQSLWQTFYDTIAIEERRNPTCQRNFMPKRFWGNMCEHIPPELRKQKPTTKTPTHAARLQAAGQKLLEEPA